MIATRLRNIALVVVLFGNVLVAQDLYDAFLRYKYPSLYPPDSLGTDSIQSMQGQFTIGGRSTSPSSTSERRAVKNSVQVDPVWVSTYASGRAPNYDAIVAIDTDPEGNLYVAGMTGRLPFGTDMLLLKYDPNGILLWEQRYFGPTAGDNRVFLLDVGSKGEVHIVGSSTSEVAGRRTFVIVKFSADGRRIWDKKLPSFGDGWTTIPTALVTDRQGNAYVAGNHYLDPRYDYFLVKFGGNGNVEWTITESGILLLPEAPHCSAYGWAQLGIDHRGGLYFSGSTPESTCARRYFVKKYREDGSFEWSIYNSDYYYASALIVTDGYITIAGMYDLSRYSLSGELLWRTYVPDGFARLEVIENGKTFVISYGGSGGPHCHSTWYNASMYNGDGTFGWRRQINVSSCLGRFSYPSVVSDDGHLFIAGMFGGKHGIQKYDTLGQATSIAWLPDSGRIVLSAVALALGPGASLFVGASIDPYFSYYIFNPVRITILKYDTAGSNMGRITYAGKGRSIDYLVSMTLANERELYLTARTVGQGDSASIWTLAKFDNLTGKEVFARTTFVDSGSGQPLCMHAANDGSVYQAGYRSVSVSNGSDYSHALLLKLDSTGERVWQRESALAGSAYSSLALDDSGNIYAAGYSATQFAVPNFIIQKYFPNGAAGWTFKFSTLDFSWRGLEFLVRLDGRQNAYAVHKSSGIFLKASSSGSLEWQQRLIPERDWIKSVDMTTDNEGTVYVAYTTYDLDGGYGCMTAKYRANGRELWKMPFPSNNPLDFTSSIVVDTLHNVYITGSTAENDYAARYLTIKYNKDGKLIWAVKSNPAPSSFVWNRPSSIVLDKNGLVDVVGSSSFYPNGSGLVLLRYNQMTGTEIDNNIFLSADGFRPPFVIDQEGRVTIGGGMSGDGWLIIRLVQYPSVTPTSVEEAITIPDAFSLSQNYPNPFNPSTKFELGIAKYEFVTVRICNLLGEEVAMLVNEMKQPGIYTVSWDAAGLPSGVYFYTMTAGAFRETKKLLLLR